MNFCLALPLQSAPLPKVLKSCLSNAYSVSSSGAKFFIRVLQREGGPRKRSRSTNVKYFRAPFRVDNMRLQHDAQHKEKWREYKTL